MARSISPSAVNNADMTLNEDIDLYLFRDGKQPAISGGQYGQLEAGRSGGNQEQPVIWDRLDGGLGSSERMLPHTYLQGIDACTRFSRAWTPGGQVTRLGAFPNGAGGRPAGRIRAIYEDGDDLLIAAGGVLYRLVYPYETANLSVEHTVDATEEIERVLIYNGIPVLGTRLIADGSPGRIHVVSGGVWVRSATANRKLAAQAYFSIDDVGEYRLAMNDTDYSFKFIATSDPVALLDDSAWSARYDVGDGHHKITNITGGPLVLYHLLTNGLVQVMPDGRSAYIADWSSSIHPDNGVHAVFAYGGVYASHGRMGLVRIDVSNMLTQWQTQACAPGSGLPRVSMINGYSGSLTMDGEWIVDSVYNGTDSHVCYGRPNEVSEQQSLLNLSSPGKHNWHGSEATFWGQEVTCLQQASIGPASRPLLWVGGMEGSTPVLQHVSLPKAATPLEDHLMGGPHRFAEQSWLYLPREDWGDDQGRGWATAKKIFTRLSLSLKHLHPYETWVDAYMNTVTDGHEHVWDRALDEDTLWTHVGRVQQDNYLHLIPGTSVQSGRAVSVMFKGTGTAEHPFVWHGAQLNGIPLLEQSERRRYRVTVGRTRRPSGSLVTQDRDFALNRLLSLQRSDPVKLNDHTKTNLIVQVEEGMRYDEVRDSRGDYVTAVTFGVRVLRRPFIWGAGQQWGTNIVWS